MTAQDYALAQAAITAALVATVLRLVRLFRAPLLGPVDWVALLELLYPYVAEARTRSAELARRFYDEQRHAHQPDEPRVDLFLAYYEPDWFREALEPARRTMARPDASESAVAQVVLRVAKEVENGGRRTQLDAVGLDSVLLGWARVATGRETCAFCLMLVSRGPVYISAEDAGLDADDTTAQDLIEAGDQKALDELMVKWHPGCDCKVVPVFNRAAWPGRDAYLRAQQIWAQHTKGHKGMDNKLNAFRRAIERGTVDLPAMAIAA